jgi:hypothetical protein
MTEGIHRDVEGGGEGDEGFVRRLLLAAFGAVDGGRPVAGLHRELLDGEATQLADPPEGGLVHTHTLLVGMTTSQVSDES